MATIKKKTAKKSKRKTKKKIKINLVKRSSKKSKIIHEIFKRGLQNQFFFGKFL